MEFIFEFLFELLFEGIFEASKSKRIPKYIRYPLIILIIIFFAIIIGLMIFTGIVILNKNILGGLFFLIISLIIAFLAVKRFRDTYLEINNKKKNKSDIIK